MNRLKQISPKKTRAQAMLEFALALPLLLTLLYGLLETGRLTFIYASTVTAARQAVRYGSATGTGPNGVPYYQDCAGIEAAAQSVGFINDFQNIQINFDSGPLTPSKGPCPAYGPAINGDRIRVSVEAQWQPIVPIVPLEPFTIHSESARTLLASVSIFVTAPAIGFEGTNTGRLNIAVTASPSLYTTVGEIITYTYTLSNTGGGDLSPSYVITDNTVTNISCPGGAITQSTPITCTGTYQITQADLDAGSVTNLATATANGIPSVNSAGTTISTSPLPKLTLSIDPDPEAASAVGATITYTYTAVNTGNVTLNFPYTIIDNKASNFSCPGAPDSIAPGDYVVCYGTYQLTNNDINNGLVTNQATISAIYLYDASTWTSNTATATVITTPLFLKVTANPITATKSTDIIYFTYTIRNTSTSTANSLNVTSSITPTITCSGTIPAGESVSCTVEYPLSQAIMDAGGYIVNTVNATAENGSTISSNTVNFSLPISQVKSLGAVITATPSSPTPPAETITAGTNIDYTYTLTNNGNVTLSVPFTVTDDKFTFTCSAQATLAPEASLDCTASYTVTDEDVTAGSIINTGSASASFGGSPVQSDPASFKVLTFSGARFSLGLVASPTSITQSATPVNFTYTITNTGGKPLDAPLNITSSLFGSFECIGAFPLESGASTSCQNSYTTSNTITNTITAATAMDAGNPVPSSNLPSVTVSSNICTTGTLTLSPPVTANSSKVATWTITNNVGSQLTVKVISISWSTQSNTYLSSVELPSGTTIAAWSPADKGPSRVISGTWTINEGVTILKMTFTQNNPKSLGLTLTFDEVGCGPLSNP
jgi:hypothetical protein